VEPEIIVGAATELMEKPALYSRMAQSRDLYGDGLASQRIVQILQQHARASHKFGETNTLSSLRPAA
jgi:UDP-N-acetylglucosamine 2-epimerase